MAGLPSIARCRESCSRRRACVPSARSSTPMTPSRACMTGHDMAKRRFLCVGLGTLMLLLACNTTMRTGKIDAAPVSLAAPDSSTTVDLLVRDFICRGRRPPRRWQGHLRRGPVLPQRRQTERRLLPDRRSQSGRQAGHPRNPAGWLARPAEYLPVTQLGMAGHSPRTAACGSDLRRLRAESSLAFAAGRGGRLARTEADVRLTIAGACCTRVSSVNASTMKRAKSVRRV